MVTSLGALAKLPYVEPD